MNARRESRVGKKQRQHLGEGDPGVRHPDKHLDARGKITRHEDGRGRAGVRPLKKGVIFREGQVAGTRLVGGREAGQDDRAISRTSPWRCPAISAAVKDINIS